MQCIAAAVWFSPEEPYTRSVLQIMAGHKSLEGKRLQSSPTPGRLIDVLHALSLGEGQSQVDCAAFRDIFMKDVWSHLFLVRKYCKGLSVANGSVQFWVQKPDGISFVPCKATVGSLVHMNRY